MRNRRRPLSTWVGEGPINWDGTGGRAGGGAGRRSLGNRVSGPAGHWCIVLSTETILNG